MQVLEPPKTTSYSNQDGHFIKTFLISTKANQAGWKVSKDTIRQMAKSFIGKPFVIIPENLSSERQKGHIFANTRDELLQEYKKYTHGTITDIQEFGYNFEDDIGFNATIKLNDSKAASALLEHGAKSWVPFAVSPHIWHVSGPENDITEWEGISLSLVPKGAYGDQAVINKYCKGEAQACTNSLAATVLCDIEDSKAASLINSSLLSQNENNNIMSTQTVQEVKEVSTTQQPIQQVEEKKEETISLTKEQHETLLKEKEEKAQLQAQLTQLVNENKTNKLNNIFKSVKDESVKKTLFDKYFNSDVNILNDFYGDVTAHVLPSMIEEAKVQAVEESKKTVTEESKSKSKAASSLPKEPVVVEDSSKAASVVPKSENEILKLSKLINGGVL